MAEIGAAKIAESNATRHIVNIDKADSPKHDTRAEIAKADLAERGAAKRKDTEGRPSNTVINIDNSYSPKHDTRAEIAKAAGQLTN